jgi:uncharacterized protein YecE (DUF72 family)
MSVLVGTSGWQYQDWRGLLYPPGLGQGRWLEYYAGRYATVENNSSFYRLPSQQTFAAWRDKTPAGFVMAVKASRYLTHVRRLRDPAQPVERLMSAASALRERLGPVLLQLPPNLPADPGGLDACLAEFARLRVAGRPVRVAVEFRHPTWHSTEVREVLTRHGAAVCWADRLGHPVTPLWRTADWGYLRFHEGADGPRYAADVLLGWARRLVGTWPEQADVHVYFNNDPGGAALYDAAAFASLICQSGRQASRTWQPAPPAGRESAPPAGR